MKHLFSLLVKFMEEKSKNNLISDSNTSDVQDARMIVFDRDLRTVGFTPAFVELFQAPYKDDAFLKNHDFDFYAPNMEELGELGKFKKVAKDGGAFIIDAYQTVVDELDKKFVDRICVYSMNGMVYTLHIDTSDVWDGSHLYMADMIKYCEDMQKELTLAKLKTISMDVHRSALLTNIDNVVLPLLYLLQGSGLDQRQSGIVDSLINNLCTASDAFLDLDDKGIELTNREQQINALVSQGKTTAEIATMLTLSPRTVEFHRANINKKKRNIQII